MKIKRNQLCFLLVTVGLILSLAACGPAPTPAPTATPYPTYTPFPSPTPTPLPPTPTPRPVLSEEPDEATFREYFSDLSLGVLAPGAKLGEVFPTPTTTFSVWDSQCLEGNIVKELTIATATYNVDTQEYAGPKAVYPGPLQTGGLTFCGSLNLPPGNYELKVYVGDILVAVLPFEVR